MASDHRKQKLAIGKKVRVLSINPFITDGLPEDEVITINSLINEICEICEIYDTGGFVCIEKTWDRGNGMSEYHMVRLRPQDFELIK